MNRKLRVGVVGTGNIFKNAHAPAWAKHKEVELVALCDTVVEKAERLASQYGVTEVYSDYQELIARDDLDIVDICTPNLYHSKVAVAALQAGKHVFCEKPDAINPEEAMKMAEAAASSGKTLMVMRNNRFVKGAQFIKHFIEEGHMGEVYTGRCGWIRRRGIPGKGGWFTTKELSGGGPLIDLGVHMLDVSMWLMGNPKPISVVGATYTKFANSEISDSVHSAFGEKKSGGTFDVEDLATGFIRFDNGATLQIEFSWASNIEEENNFYELRGTKAGCAFNRGELKVYSEIAGTLCDIIPRIPMEKAGFHERNIHHFIDVLHHRADPIYTPDQGVNMIKILSAFYESARTQSEVLL